MTLLILKYQFEKSVDDLITDIILFYPSRFAENMLNMP